MSRPKSPYKKIPIHDLQEIVDSFNNWSDLLRHFNLTPGSGNHRGIKQYCSDYGINSSHFTGSKGVLQKIKQRRSLPLENILVENSDYRNTTSLKKRLIQEKGYENICQICGQQGLHNGQPLTMVLDHINGNNRDHREDNLRMVCPNCNSQLKTSFGRSRK